MIRVFTFVMEGRIIVALLLPIVALITKSEAVTYYDCDSDIYKKCFHLKNTESGYLCSEKSCKATKYMYYEHGTKYYDDGELKI